MYRIQVTFPGEEPILGDQRGGEIKEDLLWVEPENGIRQPAAESVPASRKISVTSVSVWGREASSSNRSLKACSPQVSPSPRSG